MTTVGIICEYNPFHNGHAKQFRIVKERFGADCRIVCLMSGNYVQRGAPAVYDKLTRAQAAISCGADVVLELPLVYALSSAEGFASGGVRVLTALGVEWLCFGAESGDGNLLMSTANLLLQPQTNEKIKEALQTGVSYAAARALAVSELSLDCAAALRRPNDILAVEYCKAILRQQSSLKIYPVLRDGNYHEEAPKPENPSAEAIRDLLANGKEVSAFLPPAAAETFRNADAYSLSAGERAMLARLKGLSEEEFSKVPYGSEGLWRRFMHACRDCDSTDEIIDQTKSKRYARSRIQRMLLCAVLGVTKDDLAVIPDFVRILAFSEPGREVLRSFKDRPIACKAASERVKNDDYAALEQRCEAMYFLFRNSEKNI